MTVRRSTNERIPATGGTPTQLARAVNDLRDGKLANVGLVLLEGGTTETVIKSPLIRATSWLFLTPLSADAAAVVWWLQEIGVREATIGHDDPGASGAEFAYAVIG